MINIIPFKYLVAVGLLLLAASFIIRHYVPAETDAMDGFIKGMSIAIILLALAKKGIDKRNQ